MIGLRLAQNEWWSQAKSIRAARIDDEAQLLGSSHALRSSWLGESQTDQQAGASDLTNPWINQARLQLGPTCAHLLKKSIASNRVDHRQGRSAGNRVATESGAVVAWLK